MGDIMGGNGKWRVQVGLNKSAYKDKYAFEAFEDKTAARWYVGVNTHSGYKKRLVSPNGKIIERVIT